MNVLFSEGFNYKKSGRRLVPHLLSNTNIIVVLSNQMRVVIRDILQRLNHVVLIILVVFLIIILLLLMRLGDISRLPVEIILVILVVLALLHFHVVIVEVVVAHSAALVEIVHIRALGEVLNSFEIIRIEHIRLVKILRLFVQTILLPLNL